MGELNLPKRLEEWADGPMFLSDHRSVKAMLRIAAERIRELEQAVEHGKGLLRDQLERTAEAQMEVLSLRAITSDLKQDAARYRWLRSDDIEVLPGQHEITVVKHRLPFTDDSDETLIESELDAAIDAAMAASKGNDDGE